MGPLGAVGGRGGGESLHVGDHSLDYGLVEFPGLKQLVEGDELGPDHVCRLGGPDHGGLVAHNAWPGGRSALGRTASIFFVLRDASFWK